MGLADDVWTNRNLRWCLARGVEVVDLGLPWQEARWGQPHDPTHPNADAMNHWAEGIAVAVLGP